MGLRTAWREILRCAQDDKGKDEELVGGITLAVALAHQTLAVVLATNKDLRLFFRMLYNWGGVASATPPPIYLNYLFAKEASMKAVVMAGGEGSRLRPLTIRRPKPMVPIAGKPVMEHILNLVETAWHYRSGCDGAISCQQY